MSLKNRYWTLRHGQSKANVAGLIVSSLEEGQKADYGLTEVGRKQAAEAGQQLRAELNGHTDKLVLVHSPFSRTIQTAQCVAAQLGRVDESALQVAIELRERHFGCYELKPHENYAQVWENDRISPSKAPEGGESVQQVADRLQKLVDRLELEHSDKTVVLVSHGDTLSIFWALMRSRPLGLHREVALQTGELRHLIV